MLPITNIHWREYKTWRDPFPIGIDKFCSINFFYGSNGSGKSSLTTLIFETYQTTQGPDPDKIKVFDSSFIDKALKISDSDDKIHGAVSSFGEDNVQVDNDLMDKNIELQKILNDIELKTTEIDDAEEELKKECSKSTMIKEAQLVSNRSHRIKQLLNKSIYGKKTIQRQERNFQKLNLVNIAATELVMTN